MSGLVVLSRQHMAKNSLDLELELFLSALGWLADPSEEQSLKSALQMAFTTHVSGCSERLREHVMIDASGDDRKDMKK